MKAEAYRLGYLGIGSAGKEEREQILPYQTPQLAARACGLTICADACGKTKSIGRHAHTDNIVFGEPMSYEDVTKSGLKYRKAIVHKGEATIWWHFWTEKNDPPVVYFVPVDMLMPITAPGTA